MKELAKQLRWIIKEETRLQLKILVEPEINMPMRKQLGSLGTDIDFI